LIVLLSGLIELEAKFDPTIRARRLIENKKAGGKEGKENSRVRKRVRRIAGPLILHGC
jgi:hypothetical protein